jgi:hypothetical protein
MNTKMKVVFRRKTIVLTLFKVLSTNIRDWSRRRRRAAVDSSINIVCKSIHGSEVGLGFNKMRAN